MIMKHLKTTLIFLCLAHITFAQNFGGPKKGAAIGFSANLVDFNPKSPYYKIGKVDPGFSVMYWQGLTKNLDFSLRYNGLFTDYAKEMNVVNSYTNEFEGSLHARFLANDHLLNPFVSAGVGIGTYGKKTWAPYVPLGAGLQLNMSNEGYLFLQANYRASLAKSKLDNNMFYSLGFTQNIRSTQAFVPVALPVIPIVTDRDNDGVVDSLDACPDVAGLASLKGCPDTDGDGIADKDDKCPTVKGLAKYQGCPIPDTDGDGVNDEEDKCPKEAGPVSNFGCPVIKAEIINKINMSAKNIFFATGSAKLLAKSNASLNNVVTILSENPGYKVDIAGHTDNTGKADKNQILSDARANSVKAYMVSKGVEETRLNATGYGQDKPIADNKKAAGRSKNRRVEMTVRNY